MPKANGKPKCVPITRLVLSLAIVGVCLVLTGVAAQASAFAPAQPLKEMLNPDGTLNLTTGFRGSLDARGWQLVSGPNEPPRFAPQTAPLAVPRDQDWASNFTLRGVSGVVSGIAADGNGNVYAGGRFTAAGGVAANYVAKWSASAWSTMGNGFTSTVSALAVDSSNNVYAGGDFTLACDATCAPATSTPVNRIARWNGTSWSTMGTGMDGPVFTLAVDGNGNVYAGGSFFAAGGVTVNRIAKWNGGTWSAMGHGFNSAVSALAVDSSNNVYAGGNFSLACDATCAPTTSTPVNYIAKWNGTNWSAMGNGFNNEVTAMAVDSSNNIYAGGGFTSLCAAGPGCPGGALVNYASKWNGTAWSAMGNGFNHSVWALAVDSSNNVYAGGDLTLACDATCAPTTSTPVNYIAKWNGGAWSALSGGMSGAVYALARDGSNNVYAGGLFNRAGSASASFIAKWDGSPGSWSALGNGDAVNNTVYALARDSSNNMYAGGSFTTAGNVIANYIAKWNGGTWSAMGNGFNEGVYALAVDSSNNVYAGGDLSYACDATCSLDTSTPVNRIAKWNGSAWSAMGNGFNNPVIALAVDSSNNVYAGGNFTSLCAAGPGCPGGALVNYASKWNGSGWSAMGHGFNGPVSALAVDATNSVYAVGSFTLACDATCNPATSTTVSHVAKWNGSSWSAMGHGFNNSVSAVAVDSSNNVYAGGPFTVACDATCNPATSPTVKYVAEWNGSTWSAMGYGFNSPVNELAVDSSNNVYAGGNFTLACDATCNPATSTTVNRIAIWNGNAWSPLGSGTNGVVYALATRSKTLFVGGSFTRAGGKVSGYIGSVVIGQIYLPLTVR